MCDEACRAECYAVMERELDEAVALLALGQDWITRVTGENAVDEHNAAIEGGLWSSAPDFNGETP